MPARPALHQAVECSHTEPQVKPHAEIPPTAALLAPSLHTGVTCVHRICKRVAEPSLCAGGTLPC